MLQSDASVDETECTTSLESARPYSPYSNAPKHTATILVSGLSLNYRSYDLTPGF